MDHACGPRWRRIRHEAGHLGPGRLDLSQGRLKGVHLAEEDHRLPLVPHPLRPFPLVAHLAEVTAKSIRF
jgi:hypothetical protein